MSSATALSRTVWRSHHRGQEGKGDRDKWMAGAEGWIAAAMVVGWVFPAGGELAGSASSTNHLRTENVVVVRAGVTDHTVEFVGSRTLENGQTSCMFVFDGARNRHYFAVVGITLRGITLEGVTDDGKGRLSLTVSCRHERIVLERGVPHKVDIRGARLRWPRSGRELDVEEGQIVVDVENAYEVRKIDVSGRRVDLRDTASGKEHQLLPLREPSGGSNSAIEEPRGADPEAK